ncbi:hypothetical protein PILCRDRAFT_823184 [Piloderma croceum F 1598]|uniref:Uncharacterized protein n=1 Tax=Piloderma croceum (strain F 1598) TaxID=765440 RepID=A0A0C3F4P3_PILCF|nr:hypothetical protein PILCRDRAFT_823184 [Piloderma croceum F 1598]
MYRGCHASFDHSWTCDQPAEKMIGRDAGMYCIEDVTYPSIALAPAINHAAKMNAAAKIIA